MEREEIKDISDLHAAVGREKLIETLRGECVPYVNPDVQRLEELLAARRFSAANPPPPERVIYRIGEATIATPGNLVQLYAQPKAGKTAFLGGLLGSTMGGEGDTFGVESENAEGWAILHFDTEQSPQHHHKAVSRALRRVRRSDEPPWLYSYRMAGTSLLDRRAALPHQLRTCQKRHGAIHSVFLDGVADFIADPNNAEESFAWVEELHRLAMEYDTAIVCVLHENPNNEFGKTRGHLGSQLERKAETNLRMVKDADNVTTVFTDRSRQAHIPRALGPRFVFDLEAMMHVSLESKAVERRTARQQELTAFAREVFADVPAKHPLKWKAVIERIQSVGGVSESGAKKRLASLLDGHAVKHTERGYYCQ